MSYSKLICNISRNYSNLISKKGTQAVKPSLISQDSFVGFEKSLPSIMDTVFAKGLYPSVVEDRIRNITEYNSSGGKKLRGTLTLKTYETLMRNENISEESLQQIRTLAWAVEMMHAYFIILDDVQDCAQTRRGKLCWHLLPQVGSQALNDASLFRSFIHDILKYNFRGKKPYLDLVNMFNKAYLTTAMGQHYDSTIYLWTNKTHEKFTIDTYNKITDAKTIFYSVKLPIYLAMKIADKSDEIFTESVDFICENIGRLFQTQNDFLDCYEKDTTSTAGTDIQEGKCTWLAVTALEHCNPAQRTVFRACYGSKEPAHIERIKRLYDQLDISKLYREHERVVYDKITSKAKEIGPQSALSADLFLKLLDVIRSRTA